MGTSDDNEIFVRILNPSRHPEYAGKFFYVREYGPGQYTDGNEFFEAWELEDVGCPDEDDDPIQ